MVPVRPQPRAASCVWVWPLRPVPRSSTVTHAHILPILLPVCRRYCSQDANFLQESEVSVELGPLLTAQCVCTNIHTIWSKSLLPIAYQNCQWLPIIYEFFGTACGGLWGLSLACVSPQGFVLRPSALANLDFKAFANDSVRIHFSAMIRNPTNFNIFSHARDSRDLIGCYGQAAFDPWVPELEAWLPTWQC